jgi:hypothetical protein
MCCLVVTTGWMGRIAFLFYPVQIPATLNLKENILF